MDAMEDRIEKLEIKVSYLEMQNAELNEVVIGQEKDIALLNMKIEHLEKKVEELFEEVGPDRPSRRPPHY